MARRRAVGIDLGATKLRLCVGTEHGEILRKDTRGMQLSKKLDDYLLQITTATKDILKGIQLSEVEGVCVASPGPLNLKKGTLSKTPNIPYPEVPIIDSLRDSLGIDAYLVNDANAGALGEWLWGAGKGHKNVFYLTISTGLGGGAIVDGRLLLGKDGNAAEIGHTTIDATGRMTCGCGRNGHWEAYCSGRGIPAFARFMAEGLGEKERRSVGTSTVIRNMEAVNAAQIFTEAARGDPFATRVVEELGRLNAVGVANVVDAYDPEIVTIGGGVALNNPRAILSPIVEKLPMYAINRIPTVRITPLGDDVGILGALSVPFDPELIQR